MITATECPHGLGDPAWCVTCKDGPSKPRQPRLTNVGVELLGIGEEQEEPEVCLAHLGHKLPCRACDEEDT